MSQHRFTTTLGDTEIVVSMGWDRPLQGFFMTIIKGSLEPPISTNEDSGEEVYLFNNLEQTVSHPKELTAYLHELENRGIEIPEQMIAEVTRDGEYNVGNKLVEHGYIRGKYVREQTL